MAYADFSGKIITKSWGEARLATAEASVKAGHLLTKDGYIADCDDTKPAFWVACETADDSGTTITVAKMAVIKKPPTVATGGGVTRGDHGGTMGTVLYLASGSDQGEVIEAGNTVIDEAQECGVVLSQDEALLRPLDSWIVAALASSSACNAWRATVTDSGAGSGGISRAMYIDYTTSGTKTGTAQVNLIGADLTISADCPQVYLFAMYVATVSDKTIGTFFGISLYFEDIGNAVGDFAMVDLGYNTSHAPTGRNCFFRLRQHTTVQAGSSVLRLEGTNAAAYLVDFQDQADTGQSILKAADYDANTADYVIAVYLTAHSVTRYIQLYQSS